MYAAIEGGSASRSNPDGAPNLDNMTLDPKELRDLGDDAVATPSKYAKEWFGKNTVQTRAAARSLGRYAYAKAEAMAFRLAGNIVSARDNEDRADAIYARLPEWARW